MSTEPIPFIDLQAQRDRLGSRIDEAIARVLEHGRFILGPEVAELEQRLSEYTGAPHVVSCANGTDALVLALRALGVRPGDEVVVPAFTFAATAEAVALAGAVPVFVDVQVETFNIDTDSVADALVERPAVVGAIAVDLFGLPADYPSLRRVLGGDRFLLADAAQSMGAGVGDARVGTLTDVTTTSFFPAKPLGCYGDGGAVLTTRSDVADVVRSLRVHGKGTEKYDNVRIGTNSRLDTVQAAVLLEKLAILEDEMKSREDVAERYHRLLADVAEVPRVPDGVRSAWAQYAVRHPERDVLRGILDRHGVPTAVYYPRPLHLQPAYTGFPRAAEHLPVSERLSQQVLSLPMHPYLTAEDQERIAEAVKRGR